MADTRRIATAFARRGSLSSRIVMRLGACSSLLKEALREELMAKSIVPLLFFTASLLIASTEAQAQEDDYFYEVDIVQLACVSLHADEYLQQTGDLLVILLSTCPQMPEHPLLESAVAYSPDLTIVNDDDRLDVLVALTRQQLVCLKEIGLNNLSGSYRYYPERCEVQAR
jgi:hypothetical protein